MRFYTKHMLRILHTSDWHLGQYFIYNSREAEHQMALDWLLDVIRREEVDVLVVSGDVFDVANPPSYARTMYFKFLGALVRSNCRHVIITGGNHDSPAMLNAPGELLRDLNIHVLGNAPDDIEDVVLELRSPDGEVEALIGAVPFLRDRDLRYSQSGETGQQRIERIQVAIREYFQQVAACCAKRRGNDDFPVLVTGHLYATGAEVSGKQDNIYIGDTENLNVGDLDATFDYVALGHIHRPQCIGDDDRVWYSGSLIPLSFSETKDDKSVFILDFEGKQRTDFRQIPVPIFRRLKTVKGSLEYVQQRLLKLNEDYADHLETWVEVVVESAVSIPNLTDLLHQFVANLHVKLLKIRNALPYQPLQMGYAGPSLDELDPMDVFRKRCEVDGDLPEDMDELERTFREVQTWMTDQTA